MKILLKSLIAKTNSRPIYVRALARAWSKPRPRSTWKTKWRLCYVIIVIVIIIIVVVVVARRWVCVGKRAHKILRLCAVVTSSRPKQTVKRVTDTSQGDDNASLSDICWTRTGRTRRQSLAVDNAPLAVHRNLIPIGFFKFFERHQPKRFSKLFYFCSFNWLHWPNRRYVNKTPLCFVCKTIKSFKYFLVFFYSFELASNHY